MRAAGRACRRRPGRAARGRRRRRGSPPSARSKASSASRSASTLVEHPVLGVDARRPARGCAAGASRSRGSSRSRRPRPRARARARRARGSAARTRGFSSAAAFSVKVIARIASTATPSSQHRAHEALHQHRGLAGARAGADEQRAVAALDRRALLGGEARRRSFLDPADRGVRAAAAAGAGVGAWSESSPARMPLRHLADRARAPVERSSNSSRRPAVVVHEVARRAPPSASSAQQPARRAVVAAERHVDAAGRLAGPSSSLTTSM